jgi:DinB family protein
MATLRLDVDDARLREEFLATHFFGALAPLGPEASALWGHMTAQEMVEHLLWAFECSLGVIEVGCPTPPDQLERMKRFLYHGRPTPHDFMNPALRDGLPPLRFASLAEARAALERTAEGFLEYARTRPDAVHTHPIFGPIGMDEWSRTHFKHCAHHLLQFGLLEVDPLPEAR